MNLATSPLESERACGVTTIATLHLIVGLPGAGKTTLARRLERELPALRLNLDEWHTHLFGQDVNEPEHDLRHSLIESMLWDVAARMLELGTNVILDFGFWARVEREDYRARAARLGAGSQIHFLDVPVETLLARLEARNAALPRGTFLIPEEKMKTYIPLFQPPTPDELEPRA